MTPYDYAQLRVATAKRPFLTSWLCTMQVLWWQIFRFRPGAMQTAVGAVVFERGLFWLLVQTSLTWVLGTLMSWARILTLVGAVHIMLALLVLSPALVPVLWAVLRPLKQRRLRQIREAAHGRPA